VARLLSVNVGLPRDVAWHGQTVHTSVWKAPVAGRRMVRRLNIDGDRQGDLAGHGGEQRAVLVYQIASYRFWEKELGRGDFTFGQFGENLTVEGLPDDEVCIGDRYRIGGAVFEVTQPRVTCYRVGVRMDEPRMPALLVSSGRPGFYMRVLEEGEVEAGDDIVKVADGPERMTVARVSALLYLPGHLREDLERALRIPALSPGWRWSFQAMLDREGGIAGAPGGNPGLDPPSGPTPPWPGFRPLRIARLAPESGSVVSVELEPADGLPLVAAPGGQFVVLRLRLEPGAPPVLRSYSLSGPPSAERYRISVKRTPNGVASAYLFDRARVGDLVEVSAPRGAFTLRGGEGPVVLLGAGVGATPVLAMLHALAAEGSRREVWWLFGGRDGDEHPFRDESRRLVRSLAGGRAHVRYSRPRSTDRPGVDFDAPGRLTIAALEEVGVPRDADFYLCGPPAFLRDLTGGLAGWGVPHDRIHTEVFGPGESMTPGIAPAARTPHPPPGSPGPGPLVSFARSGLAVPWSPSFRSLLELAEACDVPARWACRTGVCHSCVSGLISGSVGYDPDPLDPPAAGSVLICCSRPTGDVVIDL
jgi:ferredoxin-NADP reductase/MOSC domain-containing protein YiiM/ferredoxin